jgi:hypothetical protein
MKSNITLSEAIEQYMASRRATCAASTVAQDKAVTSRFHAAVGDRQVRNLTAEHIERWFHSMLGDHRHPRWPTPAEGHRHDLQLLPRPHQGAGRVSPDARRYPR